MEDVPNQAEPPRHANTSVVLLAPELFATPPDRAAMRASLIQPHTRVRLLVRFAASADLALAEALAQAGVAVEVLLPAGMTVPPTALPLARMPPGSSETDTNDLALALSDVLLAGGSAGFAAGPPGPQTQQDVPHTRGKAAGTDRRSAQRHPPPRPGTSRLASPVAVVLGAAGAVLP